MSPTPQADRPCILLADDEEALIWSVSNRLVKVRPDYTVLPVSDGKAAMRVLNARHVDLLVTDIRMPGMSGLELILAARRLERTLPVIVMTAYPTADLAMDPALRRSIEYLQKPFEFDRFVTLVEDVMDRKNHGFSGAISVQMLPDIVQLYALSSATGSLWIKRRGAEGRIWFEHGAITHAATGDLAGEEAFHTIVLWSGGEFSMLPGETAPLRTIRASVTELLLESCKRLDDLRRSTEPQGPVSSMGWSSQPPAAPVAVLELENPEHVVVDMLLAAPAGEAAPSSVESSVAAPPPSAPEAKNMGNAAECVAKLRDLDGFLGAALVDSDSGLSLVSEVGEGPLSLEVACASNTEVVRAERRAVRNLGLKDEIEDIIIALGRHYCLLRPVRWRPSLFLYLALERGEANLGLARVVLAQVEQELKLG